MTDQVQPASFDAEAGGQPPASGAAATVPRFPARGVPVITGVNRVGLWSLYLKEVRRFLKVQTQTIWAPAVTTILFLVIFTVALGRADKTVLGVNFATFIAPGLIVMAMMQNAFANSCLLYTSDAADE